MTYSVEKIRGPQECEQLIRDVNGLVEREYTAANTIARQSYVYEYLDIAESFAFAVHCPRSIETRHLPGLTISELPDTVAALSLEVCERLAIKRGRVLFNVGRYPADCEIIPPHYDGELFDFTVAPGVGQQVRSAIRPRNVAILTLRNNSIDCETQLNEDSGGLVQPPNRTGDLLRFDNTRYQHGVPTSGPNPEQGEIETEPRWLRYTLGWRALEDDCFYWVDGEPLQPIGFEETIRLHELFLKEQWPEQIEADLQRGSFPFPTAFA